MRTFAQDDPQLAERLHDENSLRPFSASNLLGRFQRGQSDPAQSYALRFTALDERLAGILVEAAAPGGPLAAGAQVELDFLRFSVEAAALSPDQHPWAAAARYQDLFNAHLLPSRPPARRVSLHLASPTAFHSAGRTLPLPLPELVFGNLLERWNSFAPVALPDELRRYAAECLHISRFSLRSLGVPLKEGGLRIGAEGRVTYTSSHYDRYWMSLIAALSDFAQFSGVGAGVSFGLGQCRRVVDSGGEEE
jgi:CRISPR-associated endoribonuclease Cas6